MDDAWDDWDDAALAEIDAAIERAPRPPAAQHRQPPPPPPQYQLPPAPQHRQPLPAQQDRQLPPAPPLAAMPTTGIAWAPHSAFRPQLHLDAAAAPPTQPATAAAWGPWAAARAPPPADFAAGGGGIGGAGTSGVEHDDAPAAAPRPPPQPFDPSTIDRWIYPTNVTERSYQFEISSVAVRQNTLVSLPTGLGKTLIAAVVMYNFHRWFPTGRCVFLAPTKPLVHQQVSAVRRIIGVPLAEFAELTGNQKVEVRQAAWRTARMLFLTPQTLQNDLETGVCPAHEIVCIVIDEAHKATGNHAYVKCVQLLHARSGGYRLLALSATPGQAADKVQEVVSALRISRLEARDESSIDVRGCLNERQQATTVVEMEGEVAAARDAVGRAYGVALRKLHGLIFDTDVTRMPKFMLVSSQQKYIAVCPEGTAPHVHFRNIAAFSVAIMMAQAYELVNAYGCGSCLAFLETYLAQGAANDDASDDDDDDDDDEPPAGRRGKAAAKPKGRGGGGRKEDGRMLKEARGALFASDEFSQMAATVQRCADGVSHPKLPQTVRLLQAHFAEHGEQSRVMVFCSYRYGVAELVRWLGNVDGVRPMQFIGQSAGKGENEKGMAQKVQRQVVKQFREGVYNVLIATSIGEEGLDIGDVDLIICYDALGSATRTTQRHGRTGRKHAGRVVTLVTKGFEEQVFDKGKDKGEKMRRMLRSANLAYAPREDFYPLQGMKHLKLSLTPEEREYTPTPASGQPRRSKRQLVEDDEKAPLTGAQRALMARCARARSAGASAASAPAALRALRPP